MDEKYFPRQPHASTKELTIATLFVLGLWTVSFTVLLPVFLLLVLSSSFQKKFYTFLFSWDKAGPRYPSKEHHRMYLFKLFREGLRDSGPLRILELGVATGVNFPFYVAEDSLTLLDMNPNFRPHLEAELEKYPAVKVERFVTAKAEDMTDIESEGYDVVLCTYLLCSVSDVSKVMEEAKRVLKFGGKFAFMEHIGYPKNHFGYWIQRALSPVYSVYSCGCHLDRFLMDALQGVFSNAFYQIVYPVYFHMIFRPHVFVLATK